MGIYCDELVLLAQARATLPKNLFNTIYSHTSAITYIIIYFDIAPMYSNCMKTCNIFSYCLL